MRPVMHYISKAIGSKLHHSSTSRAHARGAFEFHSRSDKLEVCSTPCARAQRGQSSSVHVPTICLSEALPHMRADGRKWEKTAECSRTCAWGPQEVHTCFEERTAVLDSVCTCTRALWPPSPLGLMPVGRRRMGSCWQAFLRF